MDEDFEAHRADQDTEATYRVLLGQLDMYSADKQSEAERILPNDMDYLADFSKQNDNVDFAGRIVWGPVRIKTASLYWIKTVNHRCKRCSTSVNTRTCQWQKS